MRNRYLIAIIFLVLPCLSYGQAFPVFDDYSELEKYISTMDENTTLVLNFWATWCSPCVEELPSFDALHQKYAESGNIKIILVSLDFKSRLEKSLVPFLAEHKLKPEVVLLADQDGDSWIPKVHANWEGALPATVVIKGGQRSLFPEKFQNFEALESFVLAFVETVQEATCMGSKGTR